MSVAFGTGNSFTATFAGPFSGIGGGGSGKAVTVTIPAAGWKNAVSPYQQVIAVEGLSMDSKVDFQLGSDNAAAFARTAMFAVNDSGVVTVYAIGDKPGKDLTLRAALTSVVSDGDSITGDMVGTLTPRADYGQTDANAPDFIRNKPNLSGYLPETGGTMTGALTTSGILLTPNVDFFDQLPGTVVPNKLIFVKVG